ncbi:MULTISPECIES: glycoside hydrolase family 3 C-terminal domain-containing protein [Asticcacaulis]|uniref:glycoside hydrolase family 3 C-terminal domain-containing protein n=1 Tax=Asticcacaulis TaxID=76890 RepID=UPI001AE68099|nr:MULTISPECIES: glycoside hydrolase family 3 C-terminal domain-containing protein [Asticcacaulis]MBP2161151.1 beta-glucosidase [Asticcacaulis solisilvae]MDR6802196.1 beta-glucosidase [Asticcacaulis sp. BE141]
MKTKLFLFSILTALTAWPAVHAAAQTPAPYLRTSLEAKARAADLVSRMTLEEKAAQIQSGAPAIPRLGVPAYDYWNEGLHGVARAGEATVFPQAVGLAATWDTPGIRHVADVIATEFRAKNLKARGARNGDTRRYEGLTVWSPNVNIFRDPRWGRGQETWGEDPYLTSRMGVAFIKGLQGDDPVHPKTAAVVKHFAVHSGPEADRHTDDIHPSQRDRIDTYLPAFHAAVTEAGVEGVMCAYNAIDGIPACGNTDYMVDTLRKDWGFKGHGVSDCAAIADFYLPASHAYVKTPEEAVAAAIKTDVDVICDFVANKTFDPQTTINAVKQGLITEADLDDALVRLFDVRMRLGLFDPAGTGPYAAITAQDYDTPAHRELALKTAEDAVVLLKNDGLLPLKAVPKRIAIIGPNADSVDALVGNYNGTPSKPVTVYAGIKARFPDAEVTYVEGTGWVAPPLENVPDTALCLDRACSTKGLTQEEFNGPKLEGAPVATKTEANARFRWGWPTREERESSIRWAGYIKAEESGPHRFRFTGDDGYRIYVDDKLIADVWDIAWPTSDTEVQLTAGQVYSLRIEAVQRGQREDQVFQWSRPSNGDEKAMTAARSADLIVFAAGLTARLEGEEMRVAAPGFAGGDRTSLDLPAPQQKLLERLHGTGKAVVLVLMNGSAMSVNWADANLPAIVEAWYPGGEGGRAIANLLAGDFSPAGRLPVTFYKSAEQLPSFKNYGMNGRTYRYFAGEALYPFGFGLSYTTFAYGKPVVDRSRLAAGEGATVSVEVTNTGGRDGDEVVQLYVTRQADGAPIRALKGFQRMALKAGETRRVTFTLDAMALSVVDAGGNRVVEEGAADIWIGGGQPGQRAGLPPAAGVAARIDIIGRKTIAPF